MKITINIKTDNAAFEDDRDTEIARILSDYANKVIRYGMSDMLEGNLRDCNGNTVGNFKVTGR